MKTSVFWDIIPYSAVKADVSKEHVASIYRIEE
jgi:hypothetical protein